MSRQFASPTAVMQYALKLAARGIGRVEPNPPVGAVVVDDDLRLLGDGWHQQYGGPHAEVFALAQAGERARGATLFATLEPCCHTGKTPPCSRAVIAAGIRRVVAAMSDPAPHVAGGGFRELQAAGITVDVGLLGDQASDLAAPFVQLVTRHRPWVHAKWAMTLDGKLAARTGHSQWISNAASRAVVHELRGRMDTIIVGSGTVLADDPLLTARPPGPRIATRIVVSANAQLPLASRLVQSVAEAPVLLATTAAADAAARASLIAAGVEVFVLPALANGSVDLSVLCDELGRRRMTHVLLEGGGRLQGSAFDAGLIDEAHVFIAPKLVGGASATVPLAGLGRDAIPDSSSLKNVEVRLLDGDIYIHGRRR